MHNDIVINIKIFKYDLTDHHMMEPHLHFSTSHQKKTIGDLITFINND